jgi:hypothetical protein
MNPLEDADGSVKLRRELTIACKAEKGIDDCKTLVGGGEGEA